MSEYRDGFKSVEREAWWTLPRIILVGIVCLVLMYGVGFLATGGDLAIYRFWSPKRANAERQVFKHTQSFVDGKAQYITRLETEYNDPDTNAAHKGGLRVQILQEATQIDAKDLPPQLQQFIEDLQEGRR